MMLKGSIFFFSFFSFIFFFFSLKYYIYFVVDFFRQPVGRHLTTVISAIDERMKKKEEKGKEKNINIDRT